MSRTRPASSPFGFSLALAGCGAGVGSYAVAALVVAPGADLVRHVRWFLVAFAFYLLAVAVVLVAERRQKDTGTRRADLVLIFGVALLLRGALLATHPSLSDDVFRYVWDARVLNAGIHPYLYPPSAPELAPFRDSLWDGINHKSMLTPYPPLAEALFAAVYRLAPDSLTAMQVTAVAFDLAVAVLLLPMLARWGLDLRRVVIYAWNPLLLVQFAHSAHFDGAMVLPLLGAIYLLALRNRLASGLLLGASAMIKLVPALAVPLFAPLWGVAGLAGAAAMVAVALAPFLGSGVGFSGLVAEVGEARFNDSINYLLVKLLGVVAVEPEMPARMAVAATLLGASLLMSRALWRDAAGWKGLLLSTYRLLGLFLLLNAVVEPWYLTWMVPFLCFSLDSTPRGLPRLDPALGWLLLSGSVVLTDLTYLPNAGGSTWIWVRLAEYLPLYGLLVLWVWRRRAHLLPHRHEGPRLLAE